MLIPVAHSNVSIAMGMIMLQPCTTFPMIALKVKKWRIQKWGERFIKIGTGINVNLLVLVKDVSQLNNVATEGHIWANVGCGKDKFKIDPIIYHFISLSATSLSILIENREFVKVFSGWHQDMVNSGCHRSWRFIHIMKCGKVSECIYTNIVKGRIGGPWNLPPFHKFVVSPLDDVHKMNTDKIKLIYYLSLYLN